MSEIAVEVDHVWKRFHRGEFHDSLRDAIPAFFRRMLGRGTKNTELGKGDFWALKDVSFQVKHGETLGIIGHNGAGKSTMLKILSNIIRPNRGTMRVNGRLRALIEVAAGFHGDLTGRENIFLNGAILGMTQKEIASKYDEIVDFSGIEEFLDTPVKRYSSGMYARLGFAVAAHLEPEILIVDEVLSVGDAAFQKKCLGKMNAVAEEGRTVLFVSHNMAAVRNLCKRSILLNHGEIVAEGATADVLNEYMTKNVEDEQIPLSQRTDHQGDGRVRLCDFHAESGGKPVAEHLPVGSDLTLHFDYECREKLINPKMNLAFYNAVGERVLWLDTRMHDKNTLTITQNGRVSFHLRQLPLAPGTYALHVDITDANGIADRIIQRVWSVEILSGKFYEMLIPEKLLGHCIVDFSWEAQDK